MNKIRQIEQLNKRELEAGITPEGSWHADYRDTAFVYIGGLPFDVSEGDIVTIFSQYGEPVYVNLVRDKETGKSKGFAFLKYEDQRSCDLAVDNLSGAKIMGRIVSVDHTRYKKKEGEELRDNTYGLADEDEDAGAGKKVADTESESEEERRPVLKEERELADLLRNHDDDDPMKAYLVKEKKAEVEEAIKEWKAKNGSGKKKDDRRKHRHHRSRRDRDEDDEGRRRHRRRHRSRSPTEERSRSRERRRRDYSEDRDRKSRRDEDSEDGGRRTKRRDASGNRDRRRRGHSKERERKSKRRDNSEEDYRRERRRERSRDTEMKDDRRRRSPS
ncbi:RNA-binding protein Cwf29 [Botryosphaeria dothidea]